MGSYSMEINSIKNSLGDSIKDLVSDIILYYENEMEILQDKIKDLQDQMETINYELDQLRANSK